MNSLRKLYPRFSFVTLFIVLTSVLLVFSLVFVQNQIRSIQDTPASTAIPTKTPTRTPATISTPTATLTATPIPTVGLPLPSQFMIPCPFMPKHPQLTGLETGLEARIIAPEHCYKNFSTRTPIPVEGVFSGSLDDLELWVLVYTRNWEDRLFYPQAPDACAGAVMRIDERKGQWDTFVRLGGDGSELFDIIVAAVEANSETSQLLREWLQDTCDNPESDLGGLTASALLRVEGQIRELDTITVRTRPQATEE